MENTKTSPSPKRMKDHDLDDTINLLTDQDSTENLAVANLKNALDKIKKHASVEEFVEQSTEFDALLDLLIHDRNL